MSLLYFVLVLSVIIIIHELGHLLTAKYFGVYCEEFSIGMGPVIYQKKGKETSFSIRALPLGGFVAMAGEEGVEREDIPFERTIKGIVWWKQIIVMAAGAIMNIFLAWLLFVGVTAAQGKVVIPAEPIVAGFTEDSAAQEAGLKEGDIILEITSGNETTQPKTFNDVQEHIMFFPKEASQLVVQRGEEKVSVAITPKYNEEQQRYMLGIKPPESTIKEIGFLDALRYGTIDTIEGTQSIFRSLSKLIKGIGVENLSGPVGIYQITSETASAGVLPLLTLIALLSLNIGIFNLIPLPVLDGGRIFITLIEKIVGRKMNKRMETAVMLSGVVLLVGLMLFATWQDILRIFA